MNIIRRLHTPRREALLWALVIFLLIDWGAHRSELQSQSYDFRPSHARGDLNDDFNVWISTFSARLRSLPFTETYYFANPWNYFPDPQGKIRYALYTSHPPLLTFALTWLEKLAGEGPKTVRRFAEFFFFLRIFFLFELVSAQFGLALARWAICLYLLVPATQEHMHALLPETTGNTLALGAYWIIPRSRLLASIFLLLSVGTEWTCLLFLPLLALRLPRRRSQIFLAAAALAVVGLEIFWISRFPTTDSQTSYLIHHLASYLTDSAKSIFNPAAWNFSFFRQCISAFPWFICLPAIIAFRSGKVPFRNSVWQASAFAGFAFLLIFLTSFQIHSYMSSIAILSLLPAAAIAWRDCWLQRRTLFSIGVFLLMVTEWFGFRYPWKNSDDISAIEQFHREADAAAAVIGEGSFFVAKSISVFAPDPLPFYAIEGLRVWKTRMPFQGSDRCAAFDVIFQPSLEKHGYLPLPEELHKLLNSRPECGKELYAGEFLKVVPGSCLCVLDPKIPPYFLSRKKVNGAIR